MAEIADYREKVLVVDDERLTCEIVSEVLRSEHCQPHICTHPEEALEVAREQSFALAFIDINMPGMDGIHLAKHIRQRDPFCNIIMMTGYASIDNAIQAIKIGATDYLRKPFSAYDIVLCIGRYRERKALREMISKAEERYQRLVQNVPMLIFRLRRDSRLDFVNQACHPILGYTPQEAVQEMNWLMERIHLDDRERIRNLLKSAFNSEQSTQTAECRLMHKEDRLVYALIKCISNTGCTTEDETDCIEGIIVDITDRVLLEKALVQREKLKTLGAIAAEVAHEIRNPLVSIGGFARRLQKRLPDANEAGIILRESERLERLLGRIRNYLTPVQIQLKDCSVNEIVSNCVELLSPEIRRREVACRLDLGTDLPQVTTDPDILAEVFINLIRNALAAMEKQGALVIKTFETEQNLLIDFKNERGTVKLRQPEHLFLPLDEGGESIGLPLSYRLLKNMGGLLSFVEKENQVIFTVSVPKYSEATSREVHSLPFLELVE